MSVKEIKDKLEIGIKPDAPYRHENLPDFQQDEAVDGPAPDTDRADQTDEAPAAADAAKAALTRRPNVRADSPRIWRRPRIRKRSSTGAARTSAPQYHVVQPLAV